MSAPQAPGSSRDLLLLDIALESWLRMLVERQDKRTLSGDDLVELMNLVLGNAALPGTSAELELVAAQWEAVRACPDRWVINYNNHIHPQSLLSHWLSAAMCDTGTGGSAVGGCARLPRQVRFCGLLYLCRL